MNLMSSTLLTEDTGVPFDQLQAEQIALFRAAWADAGWEHTPRVSVSRSVLPVDDDVDRRVLRRRGAATATRSVLDGRHGALRPLLHRRAGQHRRGACA